jgi:hypothetical protein
MKGWLQTLGLTALLASQALANDLELVRQPSRYAFLVVWEANHVQRRNPTMHTDNDAQGCTVAKLGEAVLILSYW